MDQCSEARPRRSASGFFNGIELHSNRESGWRLRRFSRREDIELLLLSGFVDLLSPPFPFAISGQAGRFFIMRITPRITVRIPHQDRFLPQSQICWWRQFQCPRIPPNHFVMSLLRRMESWLHRRLVMREERTVHYGSVAKLWTAYGGRRISVTIMRWID